MQKTTRAFSLIELLVVIGIIILLVAIALPSFSKARTAARTLTCQSRLRELAHGWQIYSDENDGAIVPGRMYSKQCDDGDGGGGDASSCRENWYDVGNGMKYRPRWAATIGPHMGIYAFNQPKTDEDRQDYDNEVFQCPEAPEWIDERNFGFGYNYQFLGNGRQTNDQFHNFPVFMNQVSNSGGTVIIADCLGTAAGVSPYERRGYSSDGPNHYANRGNHGFSLDPPRLTPESDRGTGAEESPRTAVDPRHKNKANAVFADGHAASMTPYELGYRTTPGGRFADADPNEPDSVDDPGVDPTAHVRPGSDVKRQIGGAGEQQPDPDSDIDYANNRMFSGTGRDEDPPPLP